MKHLMYKKTIQKIVALLLILILNCSVMSTTALAASADGSTNGEEDEAGAFGLLASPIAMLLTGIGDAANWILQFALLGDGNTTVTVKSDSSAADAYCTEHAANVSGDSANGMAVLQITKSAIDGIFGRYDIGVIKLTPAEIFAGNVAALDANFFKTNEDYSTMLGGEEKSIVSEIKGVVSGWYVAIRNIAIVGLLSVLIYLGIRMIISSSVGDKAKYKQLFMDWVIALCLIFFLHYIMVFTMTIAESITDMMAGNPSSDGTINQVIVQIVNDDGSPRPNRTFYTNSVNVARIKTQYGNFPAKMGNVVLYLAFTAYTFYFTIIYLKRIIMLAFLTVIAPFVSLTYPLDKLKDGHAQAFNFWLKEYIFYALMQPLHMLLYTVFVSSALTLAGSNMIYAIVAMAFMIPAEKLVKQMFGIHGNTEGNIAGFAGGAVAGTLLNRLNKSPKHASSGGGSGSGSNQSRPRIARNASGISEMDSINTGSVPTSRNTQQGAQQQGTQTGGTTYAVQQQDGTQQPGGAQQGGAGQGGAQQDGAQQQGGAGQGGAGQQPVNQGAGAQSVRTQSQDKKPALRKRFANAVGRRYKLAGGKKGLLKAAARGVGKAAGVYAKVGGAVAGATIGAAIGMVGDGPAGMFKGMGVGLAAGPGIANRTIEGVSNIGNTIGNTISGNNALGSFISEVRTGNADESARKNGERDFINDRANRERILQDNPQMSAKDIDDYARREYNMMYDSKTDNVDLADKALELEQSFIEDDNMNAQDAHIRAAGILNATKNYDASTFRSNKKLQEAKAAMVDRVMATSNMSEEEARARTDRHFSDIASLYGIKLNTQQPQPQPQPQPQQQQQQQPRQLQQQQPKHRELKNPRSARNSSGTRTSRTSQSQTTRTAQQQPTQQQTTRTVNTRRASRGTTSQNINNTQPVQPAQQGTRQTTRTAQQQPTQQQTTRTVNTRRASRGTTSQNINNTQPVQQAQQGTRQTIQARRRSNTTNTGTRRGRPRKNP